MLFKLFICFSQITHFITKHKKNLCYIIWTNVKEITKKKNIKIEQLVTMLFIKSVGGWIIFLHINWWRSFLSLQFYVSANYNCGKYCWKWYVFFLQVSIAGQPAGVESARAQIRVSCGFIQLLRTARVQIRVSCGFIQTVKNCLGSN